MLSVIDHAIIFLVAEGGAVVVVALLQGHVFGYK